ncbi:hypothetical protein FQN54_008357 [Arachnomyces sp. PD_36]|nr:hypothetical protein FQN54_008357 [Arachnomyces sp. PD_36]
MKFSNTVLAASTVALALGVPTTKKSKVARQAASLEFFGVNESCAEFGETELPGVLDTDYTWPDTAKIDTLREAGMNIFRVAFLMERLIPDDMTGKFDETYLGDLKKTVSHITEGGSHAILDPHNYGRYYGEIISSTDDFQAFWESVATEFKGNDLVIFDTNNEYHTMEQKHVLDLNQAAIDGIRAAGATNTIFVEGNSWSGAWTWVDVNDNMKALTDPEDNIIYEMHQYLDEDGSGTHPACVSGTIGAERVAEATEWLRENNKTGIIGEFAGATNDVCKTAVTGLLDTLSENTDVWAGALWWAAGPWWADYMYSMEPGTGAAHEGMLETIKPYFPASA